MQGFCRLTLKWHASENAPYLNLHKTQYFEMLSVQGLYNDGWMLSAVPIRAPWDLSGAAVSDPATAFKFELYDLQHDWTQYTDVAEKYPTKVQEMKDLMFGEFAKYQVLPLDGSASTRFVVERPSMAAAATSSRIRGSPSACPTAISQACLTPLTPSPPTSTCPRAGLRA
jgi:hypothetical protein